MNRSSIIPEKATFITPESNRRRLRIQFKHPEHIDHYEEKELVVVRPHTTPLINRTMNQTLNTTARSSNIVNFRSISAVQSELNDRYQEDMSNYLRTKLHKIIERKQESFVPDASLNSMCNMTQLSNRNRHNQVRRPLDYFYTSLNSQLKMVPQKGIDEAYLLTAKQRISRLIQMKKKQQMQFKTLSSKIKAKSTINNESKGKNTFDEFKKLSIEEEEWDKNWRQQANNQNIRYKNRLLIKCNRQDNIFISIEH